MSTEITITAIAVSGTIVLCYLSCAFSYNLGWREGYDDGHADGYIDGHRDGRNGEAIDPEDRWCVVEGEDETRFETQDSKTQDARFHETMKP